MYAGHFGVVTVLQQWFPGTSPYILTFGVCIPDIVNGILSYLGIEGFTENENAGLLGVDVHCEYSHSLLGLLFLSIIYGIFTMKNKNMLPGFVASMSHFVLDWLVHNADLKLGPPQFMLSSYTVGGTGFWAAYPETSYYSEGLLCLICAFYANKDRYTLLVNALTIGLHIQFRLMTPNLLNEVLAIQDLTERQQFVGISLTLSFIVPALLFGYLLNRNNYDKNPIQASKAE